MVVSSGFLKHVAEAYLRSEQASDSIMSTQPLPPPNVRLAEWSLQLQQEQTTSNQIISQNSAKVISIQHLPARVILLCQPNSHPFQVRNSYAKFWPYQ